MPDGRASEPRGDNFGVVSHLATGAIADLFIARQQTAAGFEETLVIKALQARYARDPRLVRMFLDEARLAGELNHPSIVQIYDVDQSQGKTLITMEYIEGGTLSDIIRRGVAVGRFLPIEHALHIVGQVAAGLDHAHRHHDPRGEALRVIHGKVSLSNIMVSNQGQAKLIAFGGAVVQAEIPRESQMRPAQARYLSPEQVAGEAIDHRSDIYSLGVTLYETTVSQPLWRGPTEDILKWISSEPIRPPRSVRPDYPEALQPIVMKALEKRPADRYQSAEQLRSDLEDFVTAAGLRSGGPQLALYLRDLFPMTAPLSHERIARGATATGVPRLALHRRGPTAVRWAMILAIPALAALAALAFHGPPRERIDAVAARPSAPPSARPSARPSEGAPQVRRQGAPVAELDAPSVSRSQPADPPTLAVMEAPPPPVELRRVTVGSGAARTQRQRQPRSQRGIAAAVATPTVPQAEAPVASPSVAPPAPTRPPPRVEESPVAHTASSVAPAGPAGPAASPRAARSSEPTTLPPVPTPPTTPPSNVVDAKAVAEVVRVHAGEIQACFDRAVMEQPDVHGRLLVRAEIDAAGRVLQVSRSGPAIAGGGRLQECVLAAFRSWTFRRPQGGGKGSVTYAFRFE